MKYKQYNLIIGILAVSISILANSALAAGGAYAGTEAIPWKLISVQVFNFVILVGVLIYLLKAPISNYFSQRKHSYETLLNKAEAAKNEAEATKRQLTEKLTQLKSNAEQTAQQARSDAEALRAKIVSEAKDLSNRLKIEAEKTAQFEVERAKQKIRDALVLASVELAESNLQKQAGSEQKRLNNEFVEKIQVVRS